MHATIKTWQEKKQAASHETIAGLIIFFIVAALFVTPIVMFANQL